SFDVEANPLGNVSVDAWNSFYWAVADALAMSEVDTRRPYHNRMLAIATAHMVGKNSKSRGVIDSWDKALGLRTHRYEIAQGRPNIVIRPMAYDADPTGASETLRNPPQDYYDAMAVFHREVLE